MNRLFTTAASLVALLAAMSPAEAGEAARTILGVDISGSSTFAFDQGSADAAGAFVETYVAGLDAPHDLVMVSVGDAGLARRLIDIRAMVTDSRASSARRLAPQFGGYVRALPDLVQRGSIAPQETTSLIAFFRSLEPVCAAGNATVIVFSDGVEWNATVDGRAFAAGAVSLPKPESTFLKGCEVRLLGVGEMKAASDGDGLAARLVPQWRAFLTEAGAEQVTVMDGGFSF